MIFALHYISRVVLYSRGGEPNKERDQLDAICFFISLFNAQLFRMLIHPSSGACDLFVELFRGLYCSGSMCVGVKLWFG